MKKYTLLTLSLLTLHAPLVAFASGVYTPLVGIPGVNPTSDFNTYVNALYLLSISVAALLAVIKIVIAGVKWMMTDVVTSKGEAKKDIQGALIGLLIVLAAVLILNVINPKLTNVNLQIDQVSAVPTTSTPSGLTSSSGSPVTLSSGDISLPINKQIPAPQRKMFCESRSETLCDQSNKGVGCYVGEYYKGTNGTEYCIVRKNNNVKVDVEYACNWKGQGIPPTDQVVSTEAQRNTWVWDWDCSAAQQKCTDAGLDYDTDYFWVGVRKVECDWP